MESFRRHLKRKGKKKSVIERNIRTVQQFIHSLPKDADELSQDNIDSYVKTLEYEGESAKGFLYAMMNYFWYLEDENMYSYVAGLRRERTSKTRRKFQIKDFLNIDQEVVRKLSFIGVKDVDQMLKQGKTQDKRHQLAEELDIPEDAILELAQLSDLTRLGHVKRKLARLYYASGIHSPIEVAKYTPEELYEHLKSYIQSSGWNGMIPNLKDLENNINNSKKLKKIIE